MRRFAPGRQDGFALLMVLWMLVLVALLLAPLLSSGRVQAELAGNDRAAAAAAAAAEGAIEETLFHLLSGQWRLDGGPYALQVGGTTVHISITDEAGRLNPNDVPHTLLTALLVELGQTPHEAEQLALSVAAWRQRGAGRSAEARRYRQAGLAWLPGGRHYQSVGELAQVIGMTPALLAQISPHLTVHHEGQVQRAAADPLVRAALDDARKAGLVYVNIPPDPNLALLIHAEAKHAGATATRTAELTLRAAPRADEPLFTVFDWR